MKGLRSARPHPTTPSSGKNYGGEGGHEGQTKTRPTEGADKPKSGAELRIRLSDESSTLAHASTGPYTCQFTDSLWTGPRLADNVEAAKILSNPGSYQPKAAKQPRHNHLPKCSHRRVTCPERSNEGALLRVCYTLYPSDLMGVSILTELLARASARKPWVTIGVWALILAIALALIGSLLSSATTTDFRLSGRYESERAAALLEDRLRGPEKLAEIVIVQSPSLTVDDEAFRSKVEAVHAEIVSLGPGTISGGFNDTPCSTTTMP